MKSEKSDPVNHPTHYTAHPSGIECIQITEHMGFCLGNAVKYIWRADEKGNDIEDLKKARWYLNREIARREKKEPSSTQEKTMNITLGQPRQLDAGKGQGRLTDH